MQEAGSMTPNGKRFGTPGSRRKLCPTESPGVLSPNNDALEREQARRARGARRSSMALDLAGKENDTAAGPSGLSRQMLAEMYANCLKLASENKITSRNTWQLRLIDHLEDLVKPMQGEGGQVNFARASCTIDASVKIYSARVDAVMHDMVKMLSGGDLGGDKDDDHDNDQGGGEDGEDGGGNGNGGGRGRRRRGGGCGEVNPEATLASKPEDLSAKKVEEALAADPLFHQVSAQFDAGGPHGLLLYNLGLSTGCSLSFNSEGVADNWYPPSSSAAVAGAAAQQEQDQMVDVSCVLPLPKLVAGGQPTGPESQLTPALDTLLGMLPGRAQGQEARASSWAAVRHVAAEVGIGSQPSGAASVGGPAGCPSSSSMMAPVSSAISDAVDGDAMQVEGRAASTGMDGGDDGGDGDGDDGGGEVEGTVGQRAADGGPRLEPLADVVDDEDYGDDGFDDVGGAFDDEAGGQGGWSEDLTNGGAAPSSEWGSIGGGGSPSAATEEFSVPMAAAGFLGLQAAGAVPLGIDAARWLAGEAGQQQRGSSGLDRSWAGASHWRFRKAPGSGPSGPSSSSARDPSAVPSGNGTGGGRGRRAKPAAIDFESLPPLPAGTMRLAAESEVSLKTMQAADTLLPEDHRYDPARLGRLFLRPHVKLTAQLTASGQGAGGRSASSGGGEEETPAECDAYGGEAAALDFGGGGWAAGDDDDADDVGGGGWDDADNSCWGSGGGGADGGGGRGMELVDEPTRVGKVEVTYARRSKQIDVRALKEVLWGQLQGAAAAAAATEEEAGAAGDDDMDDNVRGGDAEEVEEGGSQQGGQRGRMLRFQDVLSAIPAANPAGALPDLSVHLCFICVLHLANEQGLVVKGSPDLASLTIGNLPLQQQ